MVAKFGLEFAKLINLIIVDGLLAEAVVFVQVTS
jgi:hypothetical protein